MSTWQITYHAKMAFKARFFRQYWMAKGLLKPLLGKSWFDDYLSTLLESSDLRYPSFHQDKRWLTNDDMTFLCQDNTVITVIVGKPIEHRVVHSASTRRLMIPKRRQAPEFMVYDRTKANFSWRKEWFEIRQNSF